MLIGDTVVVRRAGEVIPEVVAPIPSLRTGQERKFVMPTECPVCKQPITRPEGEAVARCTNLDCPAQALGRIVHFASRGAMDITHLGERTAAELLERDLVDDRGRHLLSRRPRTSPSFRSSRTSRSPTCSKRSTLRAIAPSTDCSTGSASATWARPRRGCWPTRSDRSTRIAGAPRRGARRGRRRGRRHRRGPRANTSTGRGPPTLLDKLRRGGRAHERRAQEDRRAPSPARSFVITGTLEEFSREEAEERIEALGGKVTSSLSKKTDYLVVGESPGSKLEKATKLGVKTIDEAAFKALLGSLRTDIAVELSFDARD